MRYRANVRLSLQAALVLAALGLAGCLWVPGPGGQGAGVVVVPPLPAVVVLEAEPLYFQGGFYYLYQDFRWTYSRTRNGPWVALPRDHYPREVQIRERGWRRSEDWGGDRREDRGEHGEHR